VDSECTLDAVRPGSIVTSVDARPRPPARRRWNGASCAPAFGALLYGAPFDPSFPSTRPPCALHVLHILVSPPRSLLVNTALPHRQGVPQTLESCRIAGLRRCGVSLHPSARLLRIPAAALKPQILWILPSHCVRLGLRGPPRFADTGRIRWRTAGSFPLRGVLCPP
jgi:hypothetical protein